MNGYDLSRNWFNWCFDNPEKAKPIHSAIFFFAVEHCNRLGGKEKFGFPSQMTMEAIGVRKYQTYGKALSELVDWGFITMIEKSKNQYSANIISINAADQNGIARGKALDKATIKHGAKQGHSTGQGKDTIDKPLTKEPLTTNQEQEDAPLLESEFDTFWNLYGKKVKTMDCQREWYLIDELEYPKILEHVPKFVDASDEYLCNPIKYLQGRMWLDEDLPNYKRKPKEDNGNHIDYTKVEYP